MQNHPTLDRFLADWAGSDPIKAAVVDTVRRIAAACGEIADLVAASSLAGHQGDLGRDNIQGEVQKKLDVLTNDCLLAHLRGGSVAALVSEELENPVALAAGAPLLAAIDPLDGSSNIDANISIGTIFSILPAPAEGEACDVRAFLRPGREQLAAGYAIYGPATVLVLTVGRGTQFFTLERDSRRFKLTQARVAVPSRTREFAINASNQRHWSPAVRGYIDECLAGVDGLRGVDFNMRWVASMVAEVHRIMTRGGIYLYPADERPGYEQGRLRLLYEGNPMAWLLEQAGGRASTGRQDILDVQPMALHQRVPMVVGSAEEVERVVRYHCEPPSLGERSPLFATRGLFRQ